MDSHENMDRYAEKGTVQAILFNLGYLPGGDHRIATRPNSTIQAVRVGLELLKPGGINLFRGRNTTREIKALTTSNEGNTGYPGHGCTIKEGTGIILSIGSIDCSENICSNVVVCDSMAG